MQQICTTPIHFYAPTPRFAIVTTYYCAHPELDWFRKLWLSNLRRYLPSGSSPPIFTLIGGNTSLPGLRPESGVEWIRYSGNLGSCGQVIQGKKKYWLPECTYAWMLGAWTCYGNDSDMIYLEQDCLAFGPWIQEMYSQLGSRKVIHGRGKLHGGTSTSLFLVKHDYIPQFTVDYVSYGRENTAKRIPELKFRGLGWMKPEAYGQFDFGYDADRPINVKDKVWYAQKMTTHELQECMGAGLLGRRKVPGKVGYWTNNEPNV